MIIKISKSKIEYIVLTFLIIYCSDDTLLFGSNGNRRFILARNAIYIIVTIGFLIKEILNHTSINRMVIIFLTLLEVFLFLSALVNNDVRPGTLYLMIIVFLGYLIAKNLPIDCFIENYLNIMCALSICSIIIFVIYRIYSPLLNVFPQVTNSAGNNYYFALLSSIGTRYYQNFSRNQGIFREPGVFQSYLILALGFELFYKRKKDIIRVFLFIAALAFTFSTTGYICLFIVLIAYIVSKDKTTKIERNAKIIVLGVIFIVIFFVNFRTNYLSMDGPIFSKLFDSGHTSKSARVSSIFVNLQFIAKNPFFGVGLSYLNNNYSTISRMLSGIESADNTNTLLFQTALNGIPYSIITIYSYIGFCRVFSTRILGVLVSFLVVLLSFVGENFIFSILYYVLMLYGLLIICGEYEV